MCQPTCLPAIHVLFHVKEYKEMCAQSAKQERVITFKVTPMKKRNRALNSPFIYTTGRILAHKGVAAKIY